MALDLIIGIFQRRDELANAARALRHEQKPDADLLVVCTLAGHRQGRRSAAQGRVFSNSGCLKLEPTNPSNTPYSPKMGDFRMMDVAHFVRKMNEKIF